MTDVAKQTVKIGGKYYHPGDTLPGTIEARERKRLLALGAIEPVDDEVEESEVETGETPKGGVSRKRGKGTTVE